MQKPGKVLPSPTAEMVKQFYVSDEISRIMPGTKGPQKARKRVHLQK
jgi:hypothetical protein